MYGTSATLSRLRPPSPRLRRGLAEARSITRERRRGKNALPATPGRPTFIFLACCYAVALRRSLQRVFTGFADRAASAGVPAAHACAVGWNGSPPFHTQVSLRPPAYEDDGRSAASLRRSSLDVKARRCVERVTRGGASPLAPQAPLTWRVLLAPSTSGDTRGRTREPQRS